MRSLVRACMFVRRLPRRLAMAAAMGLSTTPWRSTPTWSGHPRPREH